MSWINYVLAAAAIIWIAWLLAHLAEIEAENEVLRAYWNIKKMRGLTLRDALSLENSTLFVGPRRLILLEGIYSVYERRPFGKFPEIVSILDTDSESDAMAALTAEPAKEVR